MPWAAIAKQQPLEMCSRWKNSANPVMITVIADGERVEPLSLILTHRAERVLARLNRRGEGIKALGALPMLLGIVSSWEQNVSNDETLERLRTWNKESYYQIRKTACSHCKNQIVLIPTME